jgi:hypothetical protein
LISDYFVCVGAQKASTTWLFAALDQHPDIFTTPVKEIHYFDHARGIGSHLGKRKRRARFRKYLQRLAFDWRRFGEHRSQWAWYRDYMRSPIDDDWYERLFRHRGGARLGGEATPEYALIGQDGFRHIKRLAPDAKALFVMRNPLDQAWSQFRHFENKKDARRAGTGKDNAVRFWESEYSALMRDYPRTIDDLLAVFGAERVKFLFHEEIHADRRAAMQSLCTFLDVKFRAGHFRDLDRTRNASPRAPMPDELREHLIERHREIATGVRDRIGDIPQSWRDDF